MKQRGFNNCHNCGKEVEKDGKGGFVDPKAEIVIVNTLLGKWICVFCGDCMEACEQAGRVRASADL